MPSPKVNPKQTSWWNRENNYGFIDAQNVNLSIRDQGWKLDWKKFYDYLSTKYKCSEVYMFIGYVPDNQDMYTFFQKIGYSLVFKPVMNLKDGATKWNVDAELVLQTMIDYDEYDKAVIITGDGDFACLIKHLYKKKKLLSLIVPNENKYSIFLKRTAREKLDSLNNLRKRLEFTHKKSRTN